MPVLRGQTPDHREDGYSALNNFRLIRTQRHKLVENHNDIVELYDLEADPGEQHNIAQQQPEMLREMRRRMSSRRNDGAWRRC
jgi:arylsulfatase